MRKQIKLISLILVFAMLCSALAIFVGAADTEPAATVSDELTPTATLVENAQNIENSTPVAGASDIITSAFKGANMVYQKGGTGTVHYTVTETASGNVYGMFVANQSSITANQYANANGATLELDHNGYLVLELDIATESSWISRISLSTIIRPTVIPEEYKDKQSELDLGCNVGIESNLGTEYADGAWHKLTAIVDIASATKDIAPVVYLFIDGQFLAQQNAIAGRYDPTVAYTFSEVRLNLSPNQAVTVGQSISYDNVSASVVTAANAAAFANAVTNKTLSGTGLATAPAAEKLPAVIEMDGVKYSSINDIFNSLIPIEASVLRDFVGGEAVTCDAVLETNGFTTGLYAGEGVNVTTDGTVVTYDAPFMQSLRTSEATTDNNALFGATVDSTMPGNLVNGTYNKISDGSLHIVKDNANGGEAVRFKPGISENYLQFNTGDFTYTIAENRYVVFEFDVLSDVVFSDPRSSTFSLTTCFWIDGVARYGSQSMVDALKSSPAGKYVHVTAVFQTWKSNGGSGLAFANGIGSNWGGSTYNTNSALNIGDEVKISGMRLQTSYDVTIDNVSLRVVDDTTGQLGAGFAGLSLTGWADAVNAPKSTYPPVALVNGEYVEYASDLNALLASSREHLDVKILRDDATPLVVDCDATVNTNGCAVTVNAADGVTVTSSEGNVTVYDAPFKPSMSIGAQLTTNPQVLELVKYPASDNLVKISVFNAFTGAAGFPSAHTATNTIDGNSFLYYETEGAASNSNAFIDYSYGNVIEYDASNAQYLVYDFDFSFIDAVGNAGLAFITRSNNGSNIAQVTGTSINIHQYVKDYNNFHHITIVYDLHNNMAYYFADGMLHGQTGTVYSDEGYGIFTGAVNPNNYKVYFDALRIAQNPQTDMAIDNMYLRYLVGSEAGNIGDAISSGTITAWDKSAYDGTDLEFPPIASVNGKYYSSLNELNTTMSLIGESEVEILNTFDGTLVVGRDATVNTNGLEVSVAPAEGVTVVSTEGNVTVYDAPFSESSSSVMAGSSGTTMDIVTAGRYDATDNLWNSYSSNNTNNPDGMYTYVTTNKYTGETYITVKGGPEGENNSYLTMTPSNSGDVYNDPNSNTYMAIDLDVARFGELSSTFRFQPIFRHYHDTLYTNKNAPMGGSSWTDGKLTEALNAANAGEFQHITVIYDFDNNIAYWFLNDVHIYTTINGVYAEAANEIYNKESYDTANNERFVFENFRFVQHNTDDFALDNIYIRILGADVAEAAISNLTLGDADVTDESYDKTEVAPLASINDEYYGSVESVNSALTTEDNAVVGILATFEGVLHFKGDATVNTNGLKFEYTTDKGLTDLGGVVAADPMVVIASEDGTTVKFIKLTAANAADYCTATYWYSTLEGFEDVEEIIYFPYGTQIEYIGTQILHPVFQYDNYIENGNLYYCKWLGGENLDEEIETLPIASADLKTAFYMVDISTKPVDIGIKTIKGNLTLNESFGVNIYIPAAEIGATKDLVNIGGVDYVVFSDTVLPTEVMEDIEFLVEYQIEGVSYCELISTSVLNYAKELLAGNESDAMKSLVVAALNYANEACKLLAGNEYAALVEFLTANAKYLPTDNTDYTVGKDVSALKDIVKGVQLSLETETAYVINLAGGYTGQITVSYLNLAGETVTETFEAGEEVKVNIKALDLANGITITAGEASVNYSLAAYVNGLESKGTAANFAKALNVYANTAKAFASAESN